MASKLEYTIAEFTRCANWLRQAIADRKALAVSPPPQDPMGPADDLTLAWGEFGGSCGLLWDEINRLVPENIREALGRDDRWAEFGDTDEDDPDGELLLAGMCEVVAWIYLKRTGKTYRPSNTFTRELKVWRRSDKRLDDLNLTEEQ